MPSWDENGNPITQPKQQWDEFGKPIGSPVQTSVPHSHPTPTTPTPPPTFRTRFSEVTTGFPHPAEAVKYAAQQWWQHPRSMATATVKGLGTGEVGPGALVRHPVEAAKGFIAAPEISDDVRNRRYSALAGDVLGAATNIYMMSPVKGRITQRVLGAASSVPGFNNLPNLLHEGGLGAQAEIVKAADAVESGVGSAADTIAKTDKINAPGGSVEASPIQKGVQVAYERYNKNPQAYPPALADIFSDLVSEENQKPGYWSWERAKQMRSKIGAALAKASGPMAGTLGETYGNLSATLESLAGKYGLSQEWSDYNHNHKSLMGFMEGPLGDIYPKRRGVGVSGKAINDILTRDTGATNEMIKNLSAFGLDSSDMNHWTKVVREAQGAGVAGSGAGTFIKRNYGGYILGGMAAKALGLSWFTGGAAVGFGVPLIQRLRAGISASNHPFAAEGMRLLADRELRPFRPSTPILKPPPAPEVAASKVPMATSYKMSTQETEQSKLESNVPLNLRPGPGEQPLVNALLEVLQTTPEKDRQAMASELRSELEKGFEAARTRNRMNDSMQQYRRK